MELTHGACYRALAARDARFDGRFFTGVVTTGVYCRPVCPSRTPAARNVRFYPSAAAAERAGFRACRRCRPEAAPGTPAWSGTGATVSRALRLISDGALEERGIEALARRLGVTSRHLRRLFDEELGASPVEVAQVRRLHFARRLLAETALPISQVAFAAGYGSLRRFHEAVRASFGAPASSVRGLRSRGASREAFVTLSIPVRAPFDAAGILRFLAARAIPGIEAVSGRVYRRALRIADSLLVVEVEARPSGLAVRAPVSASDRLLVLSERARRLFDAASEPGAIARHLRRDPLLRPLLARRPGLRLPGAWDPFEIAVRAVLGQQISVAAARTLAGRLVLAAGRALPAPEGALTHAFPGPRELLDADLSGIGITRARQETLRALSGAFAAGAVEAGGGLARIVETLRAVPGIGDWSAHYVALRGFSEPDAFPAADLGLKRAFERAGLPATRAAIEERAERWRPWRGYAALHLWASLAEEER